MSDPFERGVLYTDHRALVAGTPLASLWSYETVRSCGSSDPPYQYWLHRSDPLLNTMLPGTDVSVVVNFGDPWATGRSLPSSSLIPTMSVIGPFTWPQFLRVGRRVCAIGAVFPSVVASDFVGVPAPEPDTLAVLRTALLARLDPRRSSKRSDAPRRVSSRCVGGGLSIDRMSRHYGISRQRFCPRTSASGRASRPRPASTTRRT